MLKMDLINRLGGVNALKQLKSFNLIIHKQIRIQQLKFSRNQRKV